MQRMIKRFSYTVGDEESLKRFAREFLPTLRQLTKVIIEPEHTTVLDINGDGAVIDGLTFGDPVLEFFLRELGVVFDKARLHDSSRVPSGKKEFDIRACYPWGHDRVL